MSTVRPIRAWALSRDRAIYVHGLALNSFDLWWIPLSDTPVSPEHHTGFFGIVASLRFYDNEVKDDPIRSAMVEYDNGAQLHIDDGEPAGNFRAVDWFVAGPHIDQQPSGSRAIDIHRSFIDGVENVMDGVASLWNVEQSND